jgi:hypothetical protein
MDEAIGQINGRAAGLACGAEGIPFGAAEDLVDQHGFHLPQAGAGVKPVRIWSGCGFRKVQGLSLPGGDAI